MNDTSLITFKAITNFVNELGEVFASKHKPLKLYRHLLNKTRISLDKVIMKHINAFRKFCIANRDGIREKEMSKFTKKTIRYSKNVYINMKQIFSLADKDTSAVIWNHLLCISALVDPAGKAKEILRQNQEDGKSGEDETEFLTNIISKVEQSVQPDSDPMAAVSSIMSSGIFTDLIGGMSSGLNSGKLDLGKLVGAVQGMVSSLGNEMGDNEEAAGAMNMLSNMTSMMGNMTGEDGQQQMQAPDMGQMMAGMQQMMGSMGASPETKIEEVQEPQEESREQQ
jgi:hypothetical protein